MSINVVNLIGRWTKPLELKFLPGSGTAVAKGTLAVDRKKGKDGQQETDFIQITLFGKTAESTANYCGGKGDLIAIQGHIQTGKFQDKDGNTRYTFEVVADSTQFLNAKKSSNTEQAAAYTEDEHMTPVDDDDPLPF